MNWSELDIEHKLSTIYYLDGRSAVSIATRPLPASVAQPYGENLRGKCNHFISSC